MWGPTVWEPTVIRISKESGGLQSNIRISKESGGLQSGGLQSGGVRAGKERERKQYLRPFRGGVAEVVISSL